MKKKKDTISRAESDRVTHNYCKHPIRVALLESIPGVVHQMRV